MMQQRIQQAHELYCQLTGQELSLGFGRERLWFEFLRAGHSTDELRTLILYLQKEILHARRNVGALKLYNLLQPDRFEEDLQISRVKLKPPALPNVHPPSYRPLSNKEVQQGRQNALRQLHHLKKSLR